jgi:ribosomal protein S18 acetylase RimI-like enzyme
MTDDIPGMSALTRIAAKKDEPALKALWRLVFGDEAADIDRFFETYFSPELTVVIGEGGAPAAMAFIVPIGDLVLPQLCRNIGQIGGGQFEPGHISVRRYGCAMLYAIAAHPDFRGRGYGAAVTRSAGILAVRSGYSAVVLKPAEDGLFGFYEKHTEFREFFSACDLELKRDALPPDRRLTLTPLSPAEYRKLRGELLRGAVYIDTDERGLDYQRQLCAPFGGLYKISEPGGGAAGHVAPVKVAGMRVSFGGTAGCAIVEPDGGAAQDGSAVHIKELLLNGSCSTAEAVSAVASVFPAERYAVRTPSPRAGLPGSELRRFGMIMPARGVENAKSLHTAIWYGPAFD